MGDRVRRCTICHRYIEGAPDPGLVHDGPCGQACKSHHHPSPCDYTHKDTGPCDFHGEHISSEEEELTMTQLQARDATRQEELDNMASELVTLKEKQVQFDQVSSELKEMREMIKSMHRAEPVPRSGLSNSPTATKNASTPTSQTPAVTSSQGAAGGTSLIQDVASHVEKNTSPPVSSQARGVYTGSTMNDLRQDRDLDTITAKVLAALESRIPQIRSHIANVDQSNPPQPQQHSHQAGLHSVQSVVQSNDLGCSGQSNLSQQTSYQTVASGVQYGAHTQVAAALPVRPVTSHSQGPTYFPADSSSPHVAFTALLEGAAGDRSTSIGQAPVDRQGTGGGLLLPEDQFLDAAAIMNMCTVSNRRQLRPYEFARMGRFSYASKITDKNINVPLYVLGYLQYIVAMLKGVAPTQSDTEVVDRLINLMTIMEITANNSTLEDFKCPGWSIGHEYASRIFHDIEYGRLQWKNLADGLQPPTFLYAKDTVDMQQQQNRSVRGGRAEQGRGEQGRGRGRGGRGGRGGSASGQRSDEGNKVCMSYNGFWTGQGCAYEYNNERKCGYEHFCSSCFEKSGVKEKHKSYYCDPAAISKSGGSVSTKPVTTTSS